MESSAVLNFILILRGWGLDLAGERKQKDKRCGGKCEMRI